MLGNNIVPTKNRTISEKAVKTLRIEKSLLDRIDILLERKNKGLDPEGKWTFSQYVRKVLRDHAEKELGN